MFFDIHTPTEIIPIAIPTFMCFLNVFFIPIPMRVPRESYFHSHLYPTLSMIYYYGQHIYFENDGNIMPTTQN